MSQSDLAFKLNVSYGFIGQVESPNFPAKYNINHLDKLAFIFGCSPKDFLPNKPFTESAD
jgi:transcriptional regulator with XRE-family HTH domain